MKYTAEELEWLKRTNTKAYKYALRLDGDESYFRDDVVFKKQHVEYAVQNRALAVSAGPIASVMGVKLILLYIYGNNSRAMDFAREYALEYGRDNLNAWMKTNGVNGTQMSLPYAFCRTIGLLISSWGWRGNTHCCLIRIL